MKKFRLIKSTEIEFEYHKLYRIEALRDFGNVKKGDIGGYVESESNLSHSGNCWIYDDAKAYDQSKVSGNARICDNVQICEHAKVHGDTLILDWVKIYGYAEVYGKVQISGYSEIYGQAQIYGNVTISGYSLVYGRAQIYGNVKLWGNVQVCGDVKIYGDSEVGYQAELKGNAEISRTMDYYVGKNIWSSGRFFTYTRSNKMWTVGCFHGTGKELIDKANLDTLVSGREYERIVNYVEAMYDDLENY